MKIQSLFTKTFWLGLIFTTVMVWTVFRLSPTLAYSPTTPPAQQVAAPTTTITQKDSYYSGKKKSLYNRLGGYNAITKLKRSDYAAVIDNAAPRLFNDPLIGKYFQRLEYQLKTAAASVADRSILPSHRWSLYLYWAEYEAFP